MTADVRGLLQQLQDAHQAATPGPWEHVVDVHQDAETEHSIWSDGAGNGFGGYVVEQIAGPDAALIVAAVNALPGLVAAVRAALDLADRASARGIPVVGAEELRAALAPAATHTTSEESERG